VLIIEASSSESCSDSDESEGPSSRKMKRVKNNINTVSHLILTNKIGEYSLEYDLTF